MKGLAILRENGSDQCQLQSGSKNKLVTNFGHLFYTSVTKRTEVQFDNIQSRNGGELKWQKICRFYIFFKIYFLFKKVHREENCTLEDNIDLLTTIDSPASYIVALLIALLRNSCFDSFFIILG